MYLVVGLGNPGKKYLNTRHNVGFKFIEKLREKYNENYSEKFNGEYFTKNIEDKKVIFLRPLSYMNLSGIVVKDFAHFFKVPLDNIIVIYDDMSLPLGNYRIRYSGSSAGHNGIKNIIEQFKTNNIKRIKIGISSNNYDKVSYVLGKFTKEEEKMLDKTLEKTISIIDSFYLKDEQYFISTCNDINAKKND